MKNNYGALVEEWKVDLIVNRARKKGFRPDELEDVQQEIILKILDFRYDPEKSNGAAETTALISLIDKQLTFIRRGQARRQKHIEAYRKNYSNPDGDLSSAFTTPSPVDKICLLMDLKMAISKLHPNQRMICAALAQNETPSGIARKLGISRYAIDQIIKGIRKQFKACGLGEWMGCQ